MRKSVVNANAAGKGVAGVARAKQTRSPKRYRVYFNRRGAPKGKIWCVDEGEGTRRRYFDWVVIKGGVTTEYSGKEPDWKNPIAWLIVTGTLRKAHRAGRDDKGASIS